MSIDVWRETAAKLRSVARSEARQVSQPVTRWRVVTASPLQLVSTDDPTSTLEEGEEDFEVGTLTDVDVGDVVLVAVDSGGDYVGLGVLATASGTSGLAALKARVVTLESRASALEARATALEGRATAVEGRASAAEARLTALEGLSRSFVVAAVTSVNLGAVDGDNITGVRLTVAGRMSGLSGATFVRIKPNGLSSVTTQAVVQRYFTGPSPTYTPTTDVVFGGAPGSTSGIVIGQSSWGVSSEEFTADGTLHTLKTSRRYDGSFTSRDLVTDSNRSVGAKIENLWLDTSTTITSLVLSFDAGTFTGRVSLEIIA